MSEVERYKSYKGAAACRGVLIAVTENWLGSETHGLPRLYRPGIEHLAEYRGAVHQPVRRRLTNL